MGLHSTTHEFFDLLKNKMNCSLLPYIFGQVNVVLICKKGFFDEKIFSTKF